MKINLILATVSATMLITAANAQMRSGIGDVDILLSSHKVPELYSSSERQEGSVNGVRRKIGYAEIKHGTSYQLRFVNNKNEPIEVCFAIDGKGGIDRTHIRKDVGLRSTWGGNCYKLSNHDVQLIRGWPTRDKVWETWVFARSAQSLAFLESGDLSAAGTIVVAYFQEEQRIVAAPRESHDSNGTRRAAPRSGTAAGGEVSGPSVTSERSTVRQTASDVSVIVYGTSQELVTWGVKPKTNGPSNRFTNPPATIGRPIDPNNRR